jgi:N-acyl-D-amino-acid deacylase
MNYDIVIKNGHIIDGSGNPWFKADIGLLKGRIAKIGRINASSATRVIDAKGKFVTPGFIDIHTHSDLALLISDKADSKVRQGVTTEVIGNCGISAAPLNRKNIELHIKHLKPYSTHVSLTWSTMKEYFKRLESSGLPMNVAALVGHGTVRIAVMGFDERFPTKDEMDCMKSLVEQAMMSGAFGLSTGLVYPPSCFASTEEIVELCKVVAKYGGIYSTHVRGERETIVEAVKEAITIGEKAEVSVQLSHNAPKYGAWGRLKETLKLVADAREKGVDVTIDNDTQRDWHGTLTSILPPRMHSLEINEIIQTLRDLSKREKVKREIVEDKVPGFGPVGLVKHGRWDKIILFKCEKNKEFIGKSFAEIGKILRKDPFDAYMDMLIEEEDEGEVVFKEYISEDDILTLLKHPWVMISTDSEATASYGIFKEIASYCPASYGEYPRILEVYVRDRGVLAIEDAIRKMTSFPAQKLGVKDRGLLREGMWADIVIFNLREVKDKATGKFPHEYPEGIRYVIVNGVITVAEEEYTGALSGKVLRHRFSS